MAIRASWNGWAYQQKKLIKFEQNADDRIHGGGAGCFARATPTLMKTYSISKLGRPFGLSRSTLLYYDQIGLLKPSGRTGSGYRRYSERDLHRLERICYFREAGLTLKDIRNVLLSGGKPGVKLLDERMRETASAIVGLKNKQRVLAGMLNKIAGTSAPVDVDLWVEMLEAAGMDDKARKRWHTQFERRAPEGHNEFLLSLGIPHDEVTKIRRWSRGEIRQL
jgi:DNA-binding transcriptional MerR regulator